MGKPWALVASLRLGLGLSLPARANLLANGSLSLDPIVPVPVLPYAR